MKHFLKYYLITLAVFAVTYSAEFLFDFTGDLKALHTLFSLSYPFIIFNRMISHYKVKHLSYIEKLGHWSLYIIYLLLLFIIVGLINPFNMPFYGRELVIGIVGLAMVFGAIELVLGLLLMTFIKQDKTPNKRITQ